MPQNNKIADKDEVLEYLTNIMRAEDSDQKDKLSATRQLGKYLGLDGKKIDLTVKEFKILEKLSQAVGRVYSREQLLDDVWGYDYFGDIRTVDTHVARLRTKLGEWGEAHLKTVYAVGYKLQENTDE